MPTKYDLTKYSKSIFPWFWQTSINNAFIEVLNGGCFATVNTTLYDKEVDTLERVGYSISRLSLERSLNARFDNVLRRITVTQGDVVGAGYIYSEGETVTGLEVYWLNEAEAEPTSPAGYEAQYIYNENEAGGATSTGFTVTAPLALSSSEELIRAWIEYVQIAGTFYTLTFI